MFDDNNTNKAKALSLDDLDFNFDDDAIDKMMAAAQAKESAEPEAPKAKSLDDLDFNFDDDAIDKMMAAAQAKESAKPEAPKAKSLDDLDFNFDDDAIDKMMAASRTEESPIKKPETPADDIHETEVLESVPEVSEFKKKMDGVYKGVRSNPMFAKSLSGIVGKGVGELERLYEDPDFGVSKKNIRFAIAGLMAISLIINEKKKGKKTFYKSYRRNSKAYINSFAASETVGNCVDQITESHDKLEKFGLNTGREINRLNFEYRDEIKAAKTKKMEELAVKAAKDIGNSEDTEEKNPLIHRKLEDFYNSIKQNPATRDYLSARVIFANEALEQVYSTGASNVKQKIIREGLASMMIQRKIDDEAFEGKRDTLKALKTNPDALISSIADSSTVKKCAFMLVKDKERILLFVDKLEENIRLLAGACFGTQKKITERIEPKVMSSRKESYPEVSLRLKQEADYVHGDDVLCTYIMDTILEGNSALERTYYDRDTNVKFKEVREGIACLLIVHNIRNEEKLGGSITKLILDKEPLYCLGSRSETETIKCAALRLIKNPDEIRGFVAWLDDNMDKLNELVLEEFALEEGKVYDITEEKLGDLLIMTPIEPEDSAELDVDDLIAEYITSDFEYLNDLEESQIEKSEQELIEEFGIIPENLEDLPELLEIEYEIFSENDEIIEETQNYDKDERMNSEQAIFSSNEAAEDAEQAIFPSNDVAEDAEQTIFPSNEAAEDAEQASEFGNKEESQDDGSDESFEFDFDSLFG